MSKKPGLGRGLDALLQDNMLPVKPTVPLEEPTVRSDERSTDYVLSVPIHQIDPNPNQPRKQFDSEKLDELSASIAHTGIIQPLIVQQKNDRYLLIAGERRLRAAKRAGLKEIPIIIRDVNDRSLLEISLIENLQRSDLNPIEEAEGIQELMTAHDLTQAEVSKSLGKSRSAVANAVRLLTLPTEVMAYIRSGQLSSGHARCLVALSDESLQCTVAREIIKKGLSVRETEKLCKALQSPPEKKPEKILLPEIADAQSVLQNRLETKVKINGDQTRGKIIIDYYSPDQLQQLFDWLNR